MLIEDIFTKQQPTSSLSVLGYSTGECIHSAVGNQLLSYFCDILFNKAY